MSGELTIALSHYVPVYTFLPDNIDHPERTLKELVGVIRDNPYRYKKNRIAVQEWIKRSFDIDMDLQDVSNIMRYDSLDNLVEGLLTVRRAIFQSKIIGDIEPIKDRKTIEVLYPAPAGSVFHRNTDFISLKAAHVRLKTKASHLLWQVPEKVLSPMLGIFSTTITPNVRYAQAENEQRIQNIKKKYPSRTVGYNSGDILISIGEIIGEEKAALLETYRRKETGSLVNGLPWALFVSVCIVFALNRVLCRIFRLETRRRPVYNLLLFIIILTVCLMKAFLVFTAFPVWAMPFSLMPMLVMLLNHKKAGTYWSTASAALLVGLIAGNRHEVFLFLLFGGLTAALIYNEIHKRTRLMILSFIVGVCNALFVFFFSLSSRSLDDPGFSIFTGEAFILPTLIQMKFAFLGGAAAGPLTLILLFFFELNRHTVSSFKLNQYMDLEHPVMRELLTKTPGTYQHTMTVAHLAQMVGEGIGANTTILRIGAYYHDIGKTANPGYFIENQFGGKNPHDEIDPESSARIIFNHLSDGVKIGNEIRLPKVIMDLMVQHHGTLLVEYFYNKAATAGTEKSKEDFRYVGPKPQSVEAAILMIVDAVEAASRTLSDPSRKNIRSLVQLIISKRISDRQFDECDLSTRDIAKIIEILIDALEASFHSRVEYPWQKPGSGKNQPEGEPKKTLPPTAISAEGKKSIPPVVSANGKKNGPSTPASNAEGKKSIPPAQVNSR